MAKTVRYGKAVPRIFTPPLRELTPETSLGFSVIDFAHNVLEVALMEWQKWLLIHMLELLPDGRLRFQTVVVLVARQNGKSHLSKVLALWFMMSWGWPLIIGTAQDLDTAEEVWEGAVELLEEDDELKGFIKKVYRVNGKKSLNLDNGTRYKVRAANRKAGRGLSGNLILLDELREHQTWDAWGAITKTTMARAEALILALSNAGDVTSRVLRYLRIMAHRALGDPDGVAAAEDGGADGPTQFDLDTMEMFEDDEDDDLDDLDEFDVDDLDLGVDDLEQDEDTLCLLEWSAAPGRDRRDRKGWRWANPSLGYTISAKTIASACRTDPEWVFRTEVLCQWNDGATSGPFTPGSWESTTIPTVLDEDGARRIEKPMRDLIVGPVVAGVAQANDRELSYIALAGYRPDGQPQVELVTGRYGPGWVGEWLSSPDRRGRIRALAGQTAGAPESTLLKKLRADRTFRMPIVDLKGSDLLDAYADADDALREERVWHPPWPALDLAAQTAERKLMAGGVWVLDPVHSPVDIAPLRAWVHALWLLNHQPPAPTPPAASPKALEESSAASSRGSAARDGWQSPTGDLADIGF